VYMPLKWNERTILLTIIYEALLIGFWFIDHAYVSLFLAVSFLIIDIIDKPCVGIVSS
jgi:hypothetical protein